jgi:TfoX/Sxy family transcriptional regulator of competence genes
MASERSFVDYVCEQANLGSALSYRKMFGEYALYLDGKVVALVCDNQLFIKPTAEGRAVLAQVVEAPPYPGAKPCFLVGVEIEDRQRMQRLFQETGNGLPMPKPKTTRAPAVRLKTKANSASKK